MVKLATEKATGREYAVKIMALPEKGRAVGENENTRDDIFKEIDILVGLNHPNVICLKEYFEESNKVCCYPQSHHKCWSSTGDKIQTYTVRDCFMCPSTFEQGAGQSGGGQIMLPIRQAASRSVGAVCCVKISCHCDTVTL